MLNQCAPSYLVCSLCWRGTCITELTSKITNYHYLYAHSYLHQQKWLGLCVSGWVSAHTVPVNISSCGTDTDKQIAAHTSLGAHLQTGDSSEALSKHVCDRQPCQTCAFRKLSSHAGQLCQLLPFPFTSSLLYGEGVLPHFMFDLERPYSSLQGQDSEEGPVNGWL